MECNRDEAMRAKTKSEEMFNRNDFASAKRFAQIAQKLHPELDGISQMLRTLDVYILSEMKVNGEPDWYKVLDVKPSDDTKTIKRQYMKLLVEIHPDKNRSVGARGAYDLITEARNVLCDDTERSAYNERRELRGSQQKDSHQSGNSSTESPEVNGGNHRPANRTTSEPNGYGSTSTGPAPVPTQTQSPRPTSTPTAVVSGSDTFWTICYGCKKGYEYLKIHINQSLYCPNCHMLMISIQPIQSSPGPYAQMPGPPANFAQPARWTPSGPYPYLPHPQIQVPIIFSHGWVSSGLGPYAPMPVPSNFIHLTSLTNGWPTLGPASYTQMLMSMNYTQPAAQEATGWAERQMQSSKNNGS